MAHFNRAKKRAGLTLMEILVASVISTVAIAMIYAIYRSGGDLWEIKQAQADLQAKGRFAMDEMVSELRQATRTSSKTPSPNLYIPASPNNTLIMFYLPSDIDGDGYITDSITGAIEWDTNTIIEYLYNSTDNTLTRLELDNSSTVLSAKNLSQDVYGAQFSDITIDSQLKINELHLALTLNRLTPLRRNISMNFSSKVRLRN